MGREEAVDAEVENTLQGQFGHARLAPLAGGEGKGHGGDRETPAVHFRLDGVGELRLDLKFLGERGQRNLELDLHRILRSDEHTSELKTLMRLSSAVFCLQK